MEIKIYNRLLLISIQSRKLPSKVILVNLLPCAIPILLTVFGFLIFKYHRLIKAVWDGFMLQKEQIETMQIENDKKTAEIVGKLGVETVKPLTEEE